VIWPEDPQLFSVNLLLTGAYLLAVSGANFRRTWLETYLTLKVEIMQLVNARLSIPSAYYACTSTICAFAIAEVSAVKL
jgi:hypothetical protein